ncbi:MAG: ATP-binding protein [Gemmatimonadaceae bacterium]
MAFESDLIRVVQRRSFRRELGAVVAVLREAARDLTGADGVTIVLREGDECYYAEENAIGPLWKGKRFPMSSCISVWAMLHRESVAIPDIYADARIPHDAYRPTFVKSLAMVPIRSEDPIGAIGAIGAYWADHHHATEDELGVLQALGDSASLAIDNVQLLEQLKEANQRKDELLSMLAHELRSPLAPIRNVLHVLRVRPDEREVVERTREMMERQVQHMGRIVDDLLDVARLTHGQLPLRRQRIDLGRLVHRSAEDRRHLMESAGLRLSVHVPETPVWVIGDPTRLAQVLGNLLDSARKFTPDGGQVVAELTADRAGTNAVVRIRDTGIGIEREMLPRIFHVFSQADRSLDLGRGGLGVGLSVAEGLIALHGGSISAASEGVGQGAEFTIRMPCQLELPALSGPPVPVEPALIRYRVLVVEDNRDAAESLRMLLEMCGYDVSIAHTGTEGVAMARALLPDIVLCDLGLPGMDGFAVATTLRSDIGTAKARLIAVTGYGEDEDRRRALEAGFDVHLVKPVDPEELLVLLAPAA